MIDITDGISVGKDVFQFFSFVKGIVGSDVISAYFKFDTTRVHGSQKIDVSLNHTDRKEIFWFSVVPIEDYVFIRFPINDSGCEEIIGTIEGEVLPDPNFWRWVRSARSGTIVGGNYVPPNAKVDFVIVGYKPKAVIEYLSNTAS